MPKKKEEYSASAYIRQQAGMHSYGHRLLLGVAISAGNGQCQHRLRDTVLAEVAHSFGGSPFGEALFRRTPTCCSKYSTISTTTARLENAQTFVCSIRHFLEAANTYHMVLRNSMTREKYSPVLRTLSRHHARIEQTTKNPLRQDQGRIRFPRKKYEPLLAGMARRSLIRLQ